MTFDCVETVAEVTHVPSFAAPLNSTWYKWDEDFSEQETDSSMLEADTEEDIDMEKEDVTMASSTSSAETQTAASIPTKATGSSLANLVHNTVSYLSYTRRWYASLSSVGAAM